MLARTDIVITAPEGMPCAEVIPSRALYARVRWGVPNSLAKIDMKIVLLLALTLFGPIAVARVRWGVPNNFVKTGAKIALTLTLDLLGPIAVARGRWAVPTNLVNLDTDAPLLPIVARSARSASLVPLAWASARARP